MDWFPRSVFQALEENPEAGRIVGWAKTAWMVTAKCPFGWELQCFCAKHRLCDPAKIRRLQHSPASYSASSSPACGLLADPSPKRCYCSSGCSRNYLYDPSYVTYLRRTSTRHSLGTLWAWRLRQSRSVSVGLEAGCSSSLVGFDLFFFCFY